MHVHKNNQEKCKRFVFCLFVATVLHRYIFKNVKINQDVLSDNRKADIIGVIGRKENKINQKS